MPTLRKIRALHGPILLHVITVKGKGRPYSESDPIKWHSPPLNFNLETGEAEPAKPGPPSYSAVFVDALRELAREDEKVVAISAAMLEGTALTRFEKEFPARTYDVGIAEEHAVMDFIDRVLGPGARNVLRRTVQALSGAFMLLLAWLLWLKADRVWEYRDATDVLRIVYGPFVYFMAAMIGLAGVIHLYKAGARA